MMLLGIVVTGGLNPEVGTETGGRWLLLLDGVAMEGPPAAVGNWEMGSCPILPGVGGAVVGTVAGGDGLAVPAGMLAAVGS